MPKHAFGHKKCPQCMQTFKTYSDATYCSHCDTILALGKRGSGKSMSTQTLARKHRHMQAMARHYQHQIKRQMAMGMVKDDDEEEELEEVEEGVDRSKCIIKWNKDGSMK